MGGLTEEPVSQPPFSIGLGRVPPAPAIDFDNIALSNFMRNFIQQENRPAGCTAIDAALRPLFGVVAPLYTSSSSSGPLVPILLAMAWVTSATFASAQYGIGKAREKYVEAVSRLQIAIQNVETASRDDTLLTVLLLGWIEV